MRFLRKFILFTVAFAFIIAGVGGNVYAAEAQKTGSGTVSAAQAPLTNPNTSNTQVPTDGDSYIVLVLDVSGSMSGTPLTMLKESAHQFCDSTLRTNSKAYISVVAFESDSDVVCPFTSDKSQLDKSIDDLSSTGGTNVNAGLIEAGDLLSQAPARAVKTLVVFSDGIPESGDSTSDGPFSSGYMNAAFKTAESYRGLYNIFTIGFFQDLSGDQKVQAEAFMRALANSNGYSDIEDEDEFQDVFDDVQETVAAEYRFKFINKDTGNPISGVELSYEYNTNDPAAPPTSYTSDNEGMITATFPADFINDANNRIDFYRAGFLGGSGGSLKNYKADRVNVIELIPQYNANLISYNPSLKVGTVTAQASPVSLELNGSNKIEINPLTMQTGIDIDNITPNLPIQSSNGLIIPFGFLTKVDADELDKAISIIDNSNDLVATLKNLKAQPVEGTFGVSGEVYYIGYLQYEGTGQSTRLVGGKFAIASGTDYNATSSFASTQYVTGTFKATAEGKLELGSINSSNVNSAQAQGLFNATISGDVNAGVGTGSVGMVSVQGASQGTVNMEAKNVRAFGSNQLENVFSARADLSGYYESGVLFWNSKANYSNYNQQLYPSSQRAASLSSTNSGLKLIDTSAKSGAANVTVPNGSEYNGKEVYPYDDPQIVELNDGRMVAVWVADNGKSKDSLDYLSLMYSIRSASGSWSSPQKVSDSEGSDFNAKLATDGNNVYVLWTRTTRTLPANATLEEAAQNLVLVEAELTGQSSSFGEVRTITNPGKAPTYYSIDATGNGVYVGWIQNSQNSFTSSNGQNDVYFGALGSARLVAQNAGFVSDFEVCGSNLYYITGDGYNKAGGSLRSFTSDGRSGTVVGQANSIGPIKNVDHVPYWGQGGHIFTLQNNAPVDTGAETEGDFVVLTNKDGQKTVLFNQLEGFTSRIYMSQEGADQTWSEPVPNTAYGQRIVSFDSVMDPKTDKPLLIYTARGVNDNYNAGSNEGPYAEANLLITPLEDQWDISVDPRMSYKLYGFTMGKKTELTAKITNHSTQPVVSVSADLTDASNKAIDTVQIPAFLRSGESKEVTFSVDVPKTNSYTIKATFKPANQTDSNMADNTATATFSSANSIPASKEFKVETGSKPSKGGTVFGGGNYANLEATPEKGFTFKGWEVNGKVDSSLGDTALIPITADTKVRALFTSNSGPVEITTQASPTQGGQVSIIKADEDEYRQTVESGKFEPGTELTLQAKPASGCKLESWTITTSKGEKKEAASGDTLTYVTETSNAKITANFSGSSSNNSNNGPSSNPGGNGSNQGTLKLNLDRVTLYLDGRNTTHLRVVGGSGGNVVWTSSNPEVASVDANGKVAGLTSGQATITASVGGRTATCAVTVQAQTDFGSDVNGNPYVIDTNVSEIVLTTRPGGRNSMNVTTSSGGNLVWSVNVPSVARVTGSGSSRTVWAVSQGNATLTISNSNGAVVRRIPIKVADNDFMVDAVKIYTRSPDYYTVVVENPRVNPALHGRSVRLNKISLFTWSGHNQEDMNAKVAQRVSANTWAYTFPVNNNAANNFYMNSDHIQIHVYGAVNPYAGNGRYIASREYPAVNKVNTRSPFAGIAYAQGIGFLNPTVGQNQVIGTVGQARHLEGIRLSTPLDGVEIVYQVHAQDIGWLSPVTTGGYAGTMGQNRPIEAVKIWLIGPNAYKYNVVYQAHVKDLGWLQPVSDGSIAGTVGQARRLEALTVSISRNY